MSQTGVLVVVANPIQPKGFENTAGESEYSTLFYSLKEE